MNNNVCCVTGHRTIPTLEAAYIKAQVEEQIKELINIGVDTFICGGALGFDMLCEIEILKAKQQNNIKLVLALPCREQDKYFSIKQKSLYEKIKNSADEVLYISDNYDKGCMHKRNKYMVDNSGHIISYCNKEKGGSFFTTAYASKRGLNIIEVGINKRKEEI